MWNGRHPPYGYEIKNKKFLINKKEAEIIYTGKIKYAGQIYQRIHQPIISKELFDIAQKNS